MASAIANAVRDDPTIIEFDVRTDEMLVNMGPQHPSTHGVLRLVLRTDGRCERLAAGGTVTGIFDEGSYEEGRISLAPGDRLVLFTDGITEAQSGAGDEFDEAGLLRTLENRRHLDAQSMVDAIFNDRKKILPCAAYLEGEYGIHGLFVGVPVVLGANGIEKVIELKLTEAESAALKKSSDSVAELVGKLTC